MVIMDVIFGAFARVGLEVEIDCKEDFLPLDAVTKCLEDPMRIGAVEVKVVESEVET